jgi:hypothetical protein
MTDRLSMIRFYLGPDDRYPRWLYWSTALWLIADMALSGFSLAFLAHGGTHDVLVSRQAMGTFFRLLMTAIIFGLMVCGELRPVLFWSLMQIYAIVGTVGRAIGRSAIGEPVHEGWVAMLIAWQVASLALSIAYVWWRDKEDAHQAAERGSGISLAAGRRRAWCFPSPGTPVACTGRPVQIAASILRAYN